jgi:hypothetical protein
VEQLSEAVVDSAVPLAVADFHKADDLLEFLLPDAVADAVLGLRISEASTRPRPCARGMRRWQTMPASAVVSWAVIWGCCFGGEDIDDAVDRLWSVCGMEGGEDEVASLGGGECDADGLEVTEFGDDDDVWILAQGLAEGTGETAGIAADFDPCGGIFLREPAKGLSVVGDGAFVDDFTARIERSDGMLGVAEIEPDGGGWNEVVHGSADSNTALKRRPLPSHLILFGFFDSINQVSPAEQRLINTPKGTKIQLSIPATIKPI